jgi:hypothetical protein
MGDKGKFNTKKLGHFGGGYDGVLEQVGIDGAAEKFEARIENYKIEIRELFEMLWKRQNELNSLMRRSDTMSPAEYVKKMKELNEVITYLQNELRERNPKLLEYEKDLNQFKVRQAERQEEHLVQKENADMIPLKTFSSKP